VIRAAENGTLFLDEIGDLDLQCQGALLRFLQSGETQPIGASSPVKVDVRVIAATNCNLDRQIKDGRFRGDLYFRLNTFTLCLPPLRERPDDILALAQYFARLFSDQFGAPLPCFSPHEKELLTKYHWPGNVREMESYFKRRVILGDKTYESLSIAETTQDIDKGNNAGVPYTFGAAGSRSWRQLSKEAKRQLLAETLAATGGNITHTAKHLGLSRRAIQKLCRNLANK
jgi:transcriptional regulator with PAS, ATPase and Fis domain